MNFEQPPGSQDESPLYFIPAPLEDFGSCQQIVLIRGFLKKNFLLLPPTSVFNHSRLKKQLKAVQAIWENQSNNSQIKYANRNNGILIRAQFQPRY